MNGRVAVITGGTSGIGLATAELFVKRGASVVVAGRRADVGQEAERMLRRGGGTAVFVQTDVCREDDLLNLVRATVTNFGRLDYAFNNAGGPPRSHTRRFDDSPADDLDYIIDTHLKGTFFSLKHEIRYFLEAGQTGAIVNMSSIYGSAADVSAFPSYVAAKHGILGLTRSAAMQYATAGIRVNAVSPGVIATDLSAHSRATDPERLLRLHPMGRLGTVGEVAAAVVWLCSDEASFITGATLPVDGGNAARS